jgi:hypothetical protein
VCVPLAGEKATRPSCGEEAVVFLQRESRLAGPAGHIAVALSVAELLSVAAAAAQPPQQPAASGVAVPSGLVVVIENRPQQARLDLQGLDKPFISGVALQIHWSDLEPLEGKADWSKLDQLFAAADASHKWVQLLIFPGFFSPAWALQGVQTEQFPIQYGPDHGTVAPLPVPWDKVYLGRWFAFLKRLSDRYGTSPAFRVIAADGPTSVSAEASLPPSPEDIKKWQQLSYRPSKYIAAWQTVFEAYAAEFPNQFVSLSQGDGLHINDDGRLDVREHLRTTQGIVEAGMQLLGRRFVLQSSDVHAGPGPHRPNSVVEDEFVIGYIGRVITGFQLRTSAERGSAVMGAEGDPPLALKKSLDLAMQPNSTGQHVDYVEVYAPDVVADDLQSVLRDAESTFAR